MAKMKALPMQGMEGQQIDCWTVQDDFPIRNYIAEIQYLRQRLANTQALLMEKHRQLEAM